MLNKAKEDSQVREVIPLEVKMDKEQAIEQIMDKSGLDNDNLAAMVTANYKVGVFNFLKFTREVVAKLYAAGCRLPTPAPEKLHVCGKCGGEMSLNPHLEAGKPPHYLEVGTKYECIPCLVLNRHKWAERAMKAENELAKCQSAQDEAVKEN